MMKSISTWKQELTEGAHAARLAAQIGRAHV